MNNRFARQIAGHPFYGFQPGVVFPEDQCPPVKMWDCNGWMFFVTASGRWVREVTSQWFDGNGYVKQQTEIIEFSPDDIKGAVCPH